MVKQLHPVQYFGPPPGARVINQGEGFAAPTSRVEADPADAEPTEPTKLAAVPEEVEEEVEVEVEEAEREAGRGKPAKD